MTHFVTLFKVLIFFFYMEAFLTPCQSPNSCQLKCIKKLRTSLTHIELFLHYKDQLVNMFVGE
jgi:hypothetical protein